MKYAILALIFVSTVLLGLTDPEGPQRDPVPEDQIVAHSSHCAGCHGFDLTGASLVDAEGNDVNIYDDAIVSMMGLSAHDPFWRATLNHEVNLFPAAKAEIETTCLKCHAPLGSQQRMYDGLSYSYDEMLADSLGLDGVSCSACHQQPPETYGTSHSGNIVLNTGRILYGPYPLPFEGPMELYVGFRPEYSDLITSSGVCAGCHTLITLTLDEAGIPTGDMFVEQATYHEWLNSNYALQGTECQSCHMPSIEDSVLIATGLKGLEKRSPFGLHQFYGANTAMLTLMGENRKQLGLSDTIPDDAWDESIQNNRMSLRNAAIVAVSSYAVFGDTLYLEVTVTNKTGHKLPSGYPSRLAWLQVVLTDDLSGDTLYANGMLNDTGHIAGRDLPFEPHHEVSLSSEDVQIYEMAMSDKQGHLTTRLNAAYQPLKDNRILPAGFRKNHPVYDTVAIWGEALGDVDYNAFSMRGQDVIEYRIPLNGKEGFADLQVSLRYHTLPSRWMQDIFQNDGIAEVSQFKAMYEGYEVFTELIDSTGLEDIDLEVSSVTDGNIKEDNYIYPNPITDRKFYVVCDTPQAYYYNLLDINGILIQTGMLTKQITLDQTVKAGTYFLFLYKDDTLHKTHILVIL